ncbi:MAG TPA: tetratricopeptide repeat protein [Terriglobia bacterium]|nr:tetratricopeptide repeat protein [Terriglobia bacterium]
MTPVERFKRSDVLRIVGITPGQLSYWERLRLLDPAASAPSGVRPRVYSFSDLVRLRTVKQLTGQRVPAGRLRVALEAFRRQWPGEAEAALTAARFIPTGRLLTVDYQGCRIEPVSGQLLLQFEPESRETKVRTMPERSLEDLLVVALECDGDPALRRRAIGAYQDIVERAPAWLEPRLNLGTLRYEDGDWMAAAREFRRAVEIAPGNPLAHFNLASVLEDLGESDFAVQHFEEALNLAPGFADAHFNLARVYEKSGAAASACAHWQRYLELDPGSEWAAYARQRLEALGTAESRAGSTRLFS